MTPTDAYRTIHRQLTKDRTIWSTVSAQATAEADDALTALEWLRQAAGVQAPVAPPVRHRPVRRIRRR